MTGKEIADAVNGIIGSLDKKDFSTEAINWGDLSVCQVDEVRPIYPIEVGKIGYTQITIEEASPDAHHFCEFIANEFEKKFGFGVVVKSEW